MWSAISEHPFHDVPFQIARPLPELHFLPFVRPHRLLLAGHRAEARHLCKTSRRGPWGRIAVSAWRKTRRPEQSQSERRRTYPNDVRVRNFPLDSRAPGTRAFVARTWAPQAAWAV